MPEQDVPSAALGGGGGGGRGAQAAGGSRGPVILKRGGNQGEMSVEDF